MLHKKIIKMVCAMLSLVLLLGCRAQQPQESTVTESIIWTETPDLLHGSLEYEKLEVEPWYCGRLEYTSGNTWAETELGYYHISGGMLYYADKANLSNWVPVCGQPDCKHSGLNTWCHARVGWNTIIVRDGRIWYMDHSGAKNEPTYIPERHGTPIICSRARNGSDHRIEYYMEDINFDNGGSMSAIFTPEHWLLNISIFNPDGTFTHRVYRVTDTVREVLEEMTTDGDGIHMQHFWISEGIYVGGIQVNQYNGDRTFVNDLISEIRGDPLFTLYRYRDGAVEKVDNTGYEYSGKYLSGNTLRFFRSGEGYYDLDLTTREETFVAPSGMADGSSTVLLPNCIIESSDAGMRFFNGTTWRDIQIPEEYRGLHISVSGVASDRILFTRRDYKTDEETGNTYQVLYLSQVRLDREELVLEYCGQIL